MTARTLHSRVLWALTKTAWWTAAAGFILAFISAHQGVST
jgi:hypothetical protein